MGNFIFGFDLLEIFAYFGNPTLGYIIVALVFSILLIGVDYLFTLLQKELFRRLKLEKSFDKGKKEGVATKIDPFAFEKNQTKQNDDDFAKDNQSQDKKQSNEKKQTNDEKQSNDEKEHHKD
jgi:hypothetical protein